MALINVIILKLTVSSSFHPVTPLIGHGKTKMNELSLPIRNQETYGSSVIIRLSSQAERRNTLNYTWITVLTCFVCVVIIGQLKLYIVF